MSIHRFHKDGQWVKFISRGTAVAAVVTTAGLLQSLPAAYGQVVWDGGGNGTSMSDGLNWVGDAVPTSGQDAVIDNSNVTVPSTIEIGDSLFGENYGTLTIDTGNTNLNIKALLTSSGFTNSTLFLDGNFTGTSDLIKIGSSVTSATITISDGAAPPTSTGQAIIELADDGKINVVNAGATLTIKSLLQGSGFIFEKTGAGTLNLGGNGVAGNSNTYGGAGKVLKVSGGTLGVATDGAMGNASNTVELSNGAKITTIINGALGPFGGEANHGFTTTRALALTSGGGTLDTNGSAILWAGQITGTGGLTKIGGGDLTLSGSSIHTYSGATNINAGTLTLSGYVTGSSPSQTFIAGGRALNTDFNVTNGATLLLDNGDMITNAGGGPFGGGGGTNNNNRIDDRIGGTYDGVSSGVQNGKAVNLSNGNFTVTGSSFGAIQEFFGSLNVQAGPNTVTLQPVGTSTGGGPFGGPVTFTPTVALYLTADNITRSSLGTVLFIGDNMGAGSVNPDPGITLFNAPTMTGGGGASGTVTMSILPYAVGNSSPRTTPSNYGLMTYQVDFDGVNFTSLGLRNLRSNEYDTLAGANGSSNHNVRVTGAETIASGGQTINGLVVAGGSIADSGSNDTLTVTTGAIVGTNNGGSSTAGSINAATLAFGGSEAFISTYGSNLVISSKITGSGLTLIKNGPTNGLGAGILFLSSTASDYTGQTLIYGGGIEVTADGALGSTAGNTVVYSGSSLLFNGVNYTTAEPVTINGTGFGTFSIFGGTQYVAIHDVTASSTFAGPVTLGSNSSIAANSGLTLTLTGGIGEASAGLVLTVGGIFNGSGTVVLTGTGSYTGGTMLYNGTLGIGSNTAIGGGDLFFNGGGVQADGSARTVSNGVTFLTNGSVTGSLDLTFNGTVSLGAFVRQLTVDNTGVTTIGGALSGTSASGINKLGAEELVITSNNAGYTGTLTATAGTLTLAGASAGGDGTINVSGGILKLDATSATGAAAMVINSGILQAATTARSSSSAVTVNGNFAIVDQDLTLSGTMALGNVSARNINVQNTTTTFSGLVTGGNAGTLAKDGPGTLVMSNNGSLYSGGTQVIDGVLGIGADTVTTFNGFNYTTVSGPVGLGAVTVYDGAAISAHGGAHTINNAVVGTGPGGHITVTGSNDLILQGGVANSYFDPMFGFTSAPLRFTVDGPGVADITGSVNLYYQFQYPNYFADFTKDGAGDLIVNGNNSSSPFTSCSVANLYVNEGTFKVRYNFQSEAYYNGWSSNGGIYTNFIGDTSGSANTALLMMNGSTSNNAITHIRSGSSGTATLGATNTSGIVNFTGPVILDKSVNLTAAAGGTVQFIQARTGPKAEISGVGAINKIGDGTVLLGGENSYSGGTNILGGTLVIGGAVYQYQTHSYVGSGQPPNDPGPWPLITVTADTDENLGNASGAVTIANNSTLKTDITPGTMFYGSVSTNPNWTSARTISVNSGGGNFDTNSYAWTLSGITNYNAGLTKLSTGTVEFSGDQNWANGSSLTVAGGAVRYNLTSGTATVGTGVTATVNAGATLELSGTTSALGSTGGNRVNVTNNSTTSVNVTGTNQVVGAITGVGNTNVSNDSDLTAKQVVQNNLTINGTAGNPNAKVTIDNDGTTPNPNSVLNTLTSLTMANDGGASVYGGPFRTFYSELDLKDNNLAIRAPAGTGQTVWTSDILPGVLTGFNNGAFGNKGLTSSTAPGAGNTALAAILNDDGFGNVLFGSGADIGAGSGQTEFDSLGALTIDDILIKYTYYGDLDLSGQVDGLDQALMDIFFGSVAGGWLFGDIDYNGFTDGLDQALLDIFFGNGTGGGFGDPLGGSGSGPATIPEPASLTLLALGGLGLVRRPRRR